MGALVQNIGSAQDKTNSTSIAISVSVTVTAGNDIFVSLSSDDAGSAHGVTDNLGNTYTLETERNNSGVAKTILFRGKITTGGTLATITCSWTSNVAAKVLLAQEFSGVGDRKMGMGIPSSVNAGNPIVQSQGGATGEFWVYVSAQETDDGLITGNHNNGTIISRTGLVQATSGGGDASNISAAQGYAFSFNTTSSISIYTFNATSTSKDGVGCGCIYYPKASLTQAAFRFYEDDVSESGSTAIAAQDTDILRDLAGGNSKVALRFRVQNSSADYIAYSETLELRASINGGAYTELTGSGDSFLPTSIQTLYGRQALGSSSANNGLGQTFKGQGGTLISAQFSIQKQGTPTDNLYAEVYAHTGTFGTTGLPTGAVLATSDNVDGSTLTTSLAPVVFPFSGGNQITLTENTSYVVVVRRVTPSGNYYFVGGNFLNANDNTWNVNWLDDGNGVTWNGSAWTVPSNAEIFYGIDEFNPNKTVFGHVSTILSLGGATTNRLGSGSGSFESGRVSDGRVVNEDNLTTSNYTEYVYPITLKQSLLSTSDTIDFRIYKRGQVLNTYTTTPRITIGGNVTTTKTQTGKADIIASTTKTQTGVARIRQTVTVAQTGVARIRVTVPRTQTGIVRLTASTTRIQSGVARLRKTVTSTQTGASRVTAATTKTQTGVANIETAYTRASAGSLPTGTSALATGYSAQDYTDVATSDNVRVAVTGTSGYLLHQFKATHTNNTTPITISWEGQSSVAASSQNVFLQVYNWNTTSWETIDTESSAATNTDFILNGSISASLSNYYGTGNVVVVRVYQGI